MHVAHVCSVCIVFGVLVSPVLIGTMHETPKHKQQKNYRDAKNARDTACMETLEKLYRDTSKTEDTIYRNAI